LQALALVANPRLWLQQLIILKIGVGVEVTLIDIVTHAHEFFKTPNTLLKDTLVTKRPRFQLIALVELVDTTSEQLDDLIKRVK
jgi:hypothetical protein